MLDLSSASLAPWCGFVPSGPRDRTGAGGESARGGPSGSGFAIKGSRSSTLESGQSDQ